MPVFFFEKLFTKYKKLHVNHVITLCTVSKVIADKNKGLTLYM